MIPLSLAEIAGIVNGRLYDADPAALVTAPPAYDSRKCEPGGLFVAFPGERTDGHDFAPAAITAGAVAVLGMRPLSLPAVVVDDPQSALGLLAREVAARLSHVQVFALTGSSGKTTTKDLLSQVLSRLGPTVATQGSMNNEIGLPVTVMRADEHTRYLALEMGARGRGHLTYLTSLIRPHIAAVLNVGTAHVGEFGSRDAIAVAKGEIIESLPAAADGGVAVLNADDPRVAAMAPRTQARVLFFGRGEGADVTARDVRMDGGQASFFLIYGDQSAPVRLRLYGEHNVANALAVAAMMLGAGADLPVVAEALSEAQPISTGRMQVVERADGVTVVNDAYNANPDSMRASITAVAALAGSRPTIAVLGEMRELGDASPDAHEQMGRFVADHGISRLIAVGGEEAALMVKAARAGGAEAELVADRTGLVSLLENELVPGDVLLVKGSNAVGLQQVAQDLLEPEIALRGAVRRPGERPSWRAQR